MFAKGPPNKSHIQEANKHLELLHKRISDVQEELATKEILFGERERELSDALEAATQSGNSAVTELNFLKIEIAKKNEQVSLANNVLKDKDVTIARLQHKCAALDYIAKQRHVFEELVSVLSGVQRLDEKGLKDNRSSFAKQLSELSKKTEAHGISESNICAGQFNQTAQPQPFQSSGMIDDPRFSISEVEDEEEHNTSDLPEDVFSRQQTDREHYL